MLGFQSGDPFGGRAGLQPEAAWLQIVKLQSLAGLAVGRELGLSTVWSWGWGTFATPGSADPDKPAAACTYLWARDPALCDAPALAVPGFDPDLTAGSVALGDAFLCRWNGGSFRIAELTALTNAGVSRAGALTTLLERTLVRKRTTVGPTAVLRAQRSVIAGAVRRPARCLPAVPAGRRARRPASRSTPCATSCSRPRSRADCGSLRSRAPT